MKKIPSVFQRNYETDRLIRDEVVPGCKWVLAGEGVATRKWDGTACMVRGGILYKRYDAKKGRTPPEGWEPCQEPDAVTGHQPGWVAVGDGPEDRWHREAGAAAANAEDGTYELIGAMINGGHDGVRGPLLVRHGLCLPWNYECCNPTFAGIRAFLEDMAIEGIVFHHPDGRMAKVKARDYGLPWPRPAAEAECG